MSGGAYIHVSIYFIDSNGHSQSVPVQQCTRCGNVVVNNPVHDSFHTSLDGVLSRQQSTDGSAALAEVQTLRDRIRASEVAVLDLQKRLQAVTDRPRPRAIRKAPK